MKMMHQEVEIAHEVAKDYVWDERLDVLRNDQLIIFAQQHRRVYRLIDKVDYIIVDCPLLMCIPYIHDKFLKRLEPLIVESHHTFENQNFVLNRIPDADYEERGRYHNKKESVKIHEDIIAILHKYDIPFIEVDVSPETPKNILSLLS